MRVIFKRRICKIFDWPSMGARILVHSVTDSAIAAPLLVDTYWINEVSRFLIFALAGLGLMVVTGYTGQVSLGHAAFLAVGAYAHAYFISHDIPFVLSLLLASYKRLRRLGGCGSGKPMTGLYLAIASLAFAILLKI